MKVAETFVSNKVFAINESEEIRILKLDLPDNSHCPPQILRESPQP